MFRGGRIWRVRFEKKNRLIFPPYESDFRFLSFFVFLAFSTIGIGPVASVYLITG